VDLKDNVMKLVLWDSPRLWLWMLNLQSAIHKWEFDLKLQKFLELPCVFQLVVCLLKGLPVAGDFHLHQLRLLMLYDPFQ